MRSRVIILALLMAAVLVTAVGSGLGPLSFVLYPATPVSANGGVTELEIQPVPPAGYGLFFERTPRTQGDRPLAEIERFIPDPLPPPLFQWPCGKESTMVASDGECAPSCGPNGTKGP